MKRILAVFIVCLFVGAASAAEKRFEVPVEGSPSVGPQNAKVTIVQFTDYQ